MLFCLLESSSCLECCEATVMGIQHCERVGTAFSEVRLCELLHRAAAGSIISSTALMVPFPRNGRMWLYWLETIHSSLLVELLPAVFALNLMRCPHFICDYWRSKNCFESLFPSSFPPISVPLHGSSLSMLS